MLIFNSLGTPSNTAIQKYMNNEKVPQLFVATGATKWNDPKEFPWTMGWQPSYQTEAHIYARYILQNKPDAKIAVLYQNDDYGKDYLKGLEDGLGAKANLIVSKVAYDVSEPTINSEMVNLQASGANVFVDIATPKFAAQSITKANELNWHPLFNPEQRQRLGRKRDQAGGFQQGSGGIISAAYLKDPTDPQWKDDPEMKAWTAFMDKYLPNADKSDASNVYAYAVARTMVQVLTHCGNDLSRENVMKQAAGLRDYDSGLYCRASRSIPARPSLRHSTAAANAVQGPDLGAIRQGAERQDRKLMSGLSVRQHDWTDASRCDGPSATRTISIFSPPRSTPA